MTFNLAAKLLVALGYVGVVWIPMVASVNVRNHPSDNVEGRQYHRSMNNDDKYPVEVIRLELIDTTSNKVVVSNVTDGMIVTSANPSFTINAIVLKNIPSAKTNQVKFIYDKVDQTTLYEHYEKRAPYALWGDRQKGLRRKFQYIKCSMLGHGTHYIEARPEYVGLPGTCGPSYGSAFGRSFTIVKPPMDATAATDRLNAIVSFVNNITLTAKTFTGPTTSADGIMTWSDPVLRYLVYEDPLQLTPDTPVNRFLFQQRYAALQTVVPFFNGVFPSSLQRHECDWGPRLGHPNFTCETMDLKGDVGVQRVVVSMVASEGGAVALTNDLALLPFMRRFNISNPVIGSLPSTIERWTDLKEFELSPSYVWNSPRFFDFVKKFPIPTTVGNWRSLERFAWDDYTTEYDLSVKPFTTGTLPSEIGRWTNLTSFFVRGKNIDGTLPSSIGVWTNLESFSTVGTAIQGSLPAVIGKWKKLNHFNVGENPVLRGPLPAVIGNWKKLKRFHVNFNLAMRGTIPDVIGNWKELQHFDMSQSLFSGTIPESVRHWSRIQKANFYYTSLNGSVPESLCNATSLVTLEADCVSEVTCKCCTKCY